MTVRVKNIVDDAELVPPHNTDADFKSGDVLVIAGTQYTVSKLHPEFHHVTDGRLGWTKTILVEPLDRTAPAPSTSSPAAPPASGKKKQQHASA